MKKIALQSFICLAFLFNSCNIDELEFDKIKLPTANPALTIKLGSANYTIKELVDDIEDEQLEINEGTDLLLTFIYRDTTTFDISSDFISIQDVNNSTSIAGGNNIPASPAAFQIPIPTQTFIFDFDAEDEEVIDSVIYRAGTLNVGIASNFPGTFNVTYTILNMKDVSTDLDYSNMLSSANSTSNRPLLGLKSIIVNNGGQNEFQLELTGTLDIPANVAVTPDMQLDLNVDILSPEFSAVFGDFGNKTVDIANQTIDMAGFSDFGDTGLELNDPRILLEIDNSYGLGMGSSLSGVKAINDDGSELFLIGDIITNGVLIEGVVNTDIGGIQTSIIEINKSNSNIDELLNSTPTSLIFPVTADLNPASTTLITNFLTDSSKIVQRTIVEIPLDLRMDGFTTDFEFDISGEGIKDAEELSIKIITLNEMPFTGSVDLQFMDVNGNILHELLNETLFNSPELGSDGRTIAANKSIEEITLDQIAIDAFLNSSTINVVLSINTFDASNGTAVKIYSDYSLELQLSVSGKFLIDLNDQ